MSKSPSVSKRKNSTHLKQEGSASRRSSRVEASDDSNLLKEEKPTSRRGSRVATPDDGNLLKQEGSPSRRGSRVGASDDVSTTESKIISHKTSSGTKSSGTSILNIAPILCYFNYISCEMPYQQHHVLYFQAQHLRPPKTTSGSSKMTEVEMII